MFASSAAEFFPNSRGVNVPASVEHVLALLAVRPRGLLVQVLRLHPRSRSRTLLDRLWELAFPSSADLLPLSAHPVPPPCMPSHFLDVTRPPESANQVQQRRYLRTGWKTPELWLKTEAQKIRGD